MTRKSGQSQGTPQIYNGKNRELEFDLSWTKI